MEHFNIINPWTRWKFDKKLKHAEINANAVAQAPQQAPGHTDQV